MIHCTDDERFHEQALQELAEEHHTVQFIHDAEDHVEPVPGCFICEAEADLEALRVELDRGWDLLHEEVCGSGMEDDDEAR